MWVLDPRNSPELLDRLRPHSDSPDLDVLWCGEGWRPLVNQCHDELVALLPDYRFASIKQMRGILSFQTHLASGCVLSDAQVRLDEITDRYADLSRAVCEWCGRAGSLREGVAMGRTTEDLTLCDNCRADLDRSPYPSQQPSP